MRRRHTTKRQTHAKRRLNTGGIQGESGLEQVNRSGQQAQVAQRPSQRPSGSSHPSDDGAWVWEHSPASANIRQHSRAFASIRLAAGRRRDPNNPSIQGPPPAWLMLLPSHLSCRSERPPLSPFRHCTLHFQSPITGRRASLYPTRRLVRRLCNLQSASRPPWNDFVSSCNAVQRQPCLTPTSAASLICPT